MPSAIYPTLSPRDKVTGGKCFPISPALPLATLPSIEVRAYLNYEYKRRLHLHVADTEAFPRLCPWSKPVARSVCFNRPLSPSTHHRYCCITVLCVSRHASGPSNLNKGRPAETREMRAILSFLLAACFIIIVIYAKPHPHLAAITSTRLPAAFLSRGCCLLMYSSPFFPPYYTAASLAVNTTQRVKTSRIGRARLHKQRPTVKQKKKKTKRSKRGSSTKQRL